MKKNHPEVSGSNLPPATILLQLIKDSTIEDTLLARGFVHAQDRLGYRGLYLAMKHSTAL